MSLDYCRPIVCANPDTGWIPFSAFRSSRQRGLSVPTGKPFSSAFPANSITAREKRLQVAASRQKRLPPRAHDDKAREDEQGGDADGKAHTGKNNADLTRLAPRGPL
jgi:hypothetical protein